MRFHLVAAVLALAGGLWFSLLSWQWGLLMIAIVLVLFAEMANTALEHVVDLASPGYAELARTAKDVAAGAVFLTALAALALGNIIFASYLAPLLQQAVGWLAHLSAPVALVDLAVSLVLLLAHWQMLTRRQGCLAVVSLALAALLAPVIVHWSILPVVTLGFLALFALWVAAGYQRSLRYLLGLVCWLGFAIWLWQREM